MPSVLFFVPVRDRGLISLLEFYREDIATLEALGFEVRVENRLWAAMWGREDLCFAWWWATSAPVAAVWWLRRKPIVVTGALENPNTSIVKQFVKGLLTTISCRLASANIAISNFELTRLSRHGPRKPARIYPAVDHTYYTPGRLSAQPSAAMVAQLNPASIERKGVDIAIAATAIIRRSWPNFRLNIIGPSTPAGLEVLRRAGSTVDMSGVVIHGELERDRKLELLQSAWVYLAPSLMEGFGLAVAEAMACGCVPICSAAGALPEVVAEAGVISRDRTPKALAEAVCALLEADDGRRRLSLLARQRAQTAFDPVARVSAMRQVLQELPLPAWPVTR
jgi:glycosyltransferase involved in cell wall biosynthesis